MLMANAVSVMAARTAGKEAVAIESFAKALRQVTLAPARHHTSTSPQGGLHFMSVLLMWFSAI